MESKKISKEEFQMNLRESNFSSWKPEIISELAGYLKQENECFRFPVAYLKNFYIGDGKKPIASLSRRMVKNFLKKNHKIANKDTCNLKTLDNGSKVVDFQVVTKK